MALYTKSVQEKFTKKDGLIICIMRRPDSWVKFDLWFPVLAPSGKLLDDYHDKKTSWKEFEKRFKKEVLIGKKEFIKLLSEISVIRKVTICCWEKTPEKCHRRLVAEACKKINKKLEVIIK